jgi:hypothetical protein
MKCKGEASPSPFKKGRSMENKFEYEIDGRRFIQRQLVPGQIKQLRKFLEGMVLPVDFSPSNILAVLGDRVSEAAAIVLTPSDGTEGGYLALKNKDVKALTEEFEYSLAIETSIQVVTDFFDCNPIASILEKLAGAATKMTDQVITLRRTAMKSTALSQPSQEETSPKETASSGDTVLQSADLT